MKQESSYQQLDESLEKQESLPLSSEVPPAPRLSAEQVEPYQLPEEHPFQLPTSYSPANSALSRSLTQSNTQPLQPKTTLSDSRILKDKQPLSPSEATLSDPSVLKEVLSYYLGGQRLLSGGVEFAYQFFLFLIALAGSTFYYAFGKNFADQHSDYIELGDTAADEWTLGVAVPITAVAVYFNAMRIFLEQRYIKESVPAALKGKLSPPLSGMWVKIYDSFILVGSTISAVPFIIIGVTTPFPVESVVARIFQLVLVGVSNIAMHFLPLQLALMYPAYRLPVWLFELIIKQWCFTPETPPENKEAKLIKAQTIGFLNRVKQHLTLRACKFNWRTMSYQWNFTQKFLTTMRATDWKSVDFLLALSEEFPEAHQAVPKSSSLCNSRSKEVFSVGMAFWIMGCLISYLTAPVVELADLLNPVASGLLMAAPIYFLGVLFNYFGYEIGQTLYDTITQWGSLDNKLPFEFKLYPKIFFFFGGVINGVVNLFSYVASRYLLDISLPDTENVSPLKSFLKVVAETGIPILCVYAIKDFIQTFLLKWGIYLGRGSTQVAAKLMASLDHCIGAIDMIPLEEWTKSKSYLVENSIINDFNIADPASGLPVPPQEPEDEADAKSSWWNWMKDNCCFWQYKKDIKKPLRLATHAGSPDSQSEQVQTYYGSTGDYQRLTRS